MSHNPLISILVPVYGVEKYIERCAVSLMEQTYDNLEYIFVDDCGKDRSIEVLKSVVKRYPARADRVRIVRHERNRGQAAARNTAVKAAMGEFLMYVDSDDWVDAAIVDKCAERQKETGADIVMTDYYTIYADRKVAERWPEAKDNLDLCLGQLQTRQRWQLWAQMVRRSLCVDNEIFSREGCNMGEDFHTSPRLSYCAHGGIAYVHECLYYYNRCNVDSCTMSFNALICAQMEGGYEVLESFFADKGGGYLDALHLSQLNTYVGYVRKMCVAGGYDELFEQYKTKIEALAPRYGKGLSVYKRLTVRLLNHRRLLGVLCKITLGYENKS